MKTAFASGMLGIAAAAVLVALQLLAAVGLGHGQGWSYSHRDEVFAGCLLAVEIILLYAVALEIGGRIFALAALAALEEPQLARLRDLVAEADAAAAHDAAFVIKPDARADIDVLRLLDLVFTEAALAFPMFHAEFLKSALTSLITNRAIQWMIDQQELHHAFAAFLCQ